METGREEFRFHSNEATPAIKRRLTTEKYTTSKRKE